MSKTVTNNQFIYKKKKIIFEGIELTIVHSHHIRQGTVVRHAQICTKRWDYQLVSFNPDPVQWYMTMVGLKRAAALTTDLAPWNGDARWAALAFVSVLEQSLLQLFHFFLLLLALLQPALLLRFAEMLLQGEFAGRFVNLLMNRQVCFQCLQLCILSKHKQKTKQKKKTTQNLAHLEKGNFVL